MNWWCCAPLLRSFRLNKVFLFPFFSGIKSGNICGSILSDPPQGFPLLPVPFFCSPFMDQSNMKIKQCFFLSYHLDHVWVSSSAIFSKEGTCQSVACTTGQNDIVPDCYDRVAASFPATKWQEPKVLSRKWCSGRRTPSRPTKHPWPSWYEHTKATLQWNEDFFMVVKKKA